MPCSPHGQGKARHPTTHRQRRGIHTLRHRQHRRGGEEKEVRGEGWAMFSLRMSKARHPATHRSGINNIAREVKKMRYVEKVGPCSPRGQGNTRHPTARRQRRKRRPHDQALAASSGRGGEEKGGGDGWAMCSAWATRQDILMLLCLGPLRLGRGAGWADQWAPGDDLLLLLLLLRSTTVPSYP